MFRLPYLDSLVQRIHSWYPSECCSDKDCRPIACDALTSLIEHVDKFKQTIQASHDQLCHVCEFNNIIRCIFIPQNFF